MLKTKIRQFFYHLRHDVFTKDHSFLIVVAALCLTFVVLSISAMSRNWDLEQRLATKQHELALAKLEVETAELENIYYHSEEYQELSARQHLNKKLPGENLVYLPDNSILAKSKHSKTTSDNVTLEENTKSNFEEWLQFLFGS